MGVKGRRERERECGGKEGACNKGGVCEKMPSHGSLQQAVKVRPGRGGKRTVSGLQQLSAM